jgi:hypothetical protein
VATIADENDEALQSEFGATWPQLSINPFGG